MSHIWRICRGDSQAKSKAKDGTHFFKYIRRGKDIKDIKSVLNLILQPEKELYDAVVSNENVVDDIDDVSCDLANA